MYAYNNNQAFAAQNYQFASNNNYQTKMNTNQHQPVRRASETLNMTTGLFQHLLVYLKQKDE